MFERESKREKRMCKYYHWQLIYVYPAVDFWSRLRRNEKNNLHSTKLEHVLLYSIQQRLLPIIWLYIPQHEFDHDVVAYFRQRQTLSCSYKLKVVHLSFDFRHLPR